MSIIGLTGKAGVGKDTIATAMQKIIWLNSLADSNSDAGLMQIAAFADPVREIVGGMFGWSVDDLKDFDFKETMTDWGFTPRRALQLFGTEFGRALDENLWVKYMERRFPNGRVIILDVRFENEADWVRSKGGRIVHIYGPEGAPTTGLGGHVSESGIAFKDGDAKFINSMNGLAKLEDDIQDFIFREL